jgi:pimeloyl-ACP methyl ester carboxylesterase
MDKSVLEKVRLSDGTPIAFYRSGSGPPLVLVAGAGAANPLAWPVVPALEGRFRVYAVDRRGHGQSGDGPNYMLEREFEDIAAVVDSIGEPVHLLRHSFGALCALEGALRTQKVRKLVLYEGVSGPRSGEALYPLGFFERLEALLESGDREGLLIAHYTENAGITPAEMEGFKASPAWPERVAIAHTVPRELRADAGYRLDPGRFKDLRTPTLLLLGGDSPDVMKEGTTALQAALPNSKIAVLPGQEHIAMYSAPELFLEAVLGFLTGPG